MKSIFNSINYALKKEQCNEQNSITKNKKDKKLQKEKQYEINKRRVLIRKQNESNRKIKQNERKQKRENIIDEDIDIGKLFELATSDKIYVNRLSLHQIESEILEDDTGDFELIRSILIGEIEYKANSRFKNVDDFENYMNV